MTYTMLMAFAIFIAVSSVTPGPNNLMLLSSSVNFGVRRTIPHCLGISAGMGLMIVLMSFGLHWVMQHAGWLIDLLKIASLAYLLWLAWKIASITPRPLSVQNEASPFGFWNAVLFQWINPKALIMVISMFSIYVPDNIGQLTLLQISLMAIVINLLCISVWMFGGTLMRRLFTTPATQRGFNIVMALLLVASVVPMVSADLGI
ncbi:MAG TPA: LysE family translocator [Advenella sp.]|nr:LysE family translocator [Advenella sp.]